MTPAYRYSRYFTYIQPIAKHPIVKAYGTAIFTVIALVVFIIFAIKPTLETVLVLQKRLEEDQKVLAKINQKAEDLSLAKTNYQNLNAQVKEKIQTSIPDSVNLKTLTGSLENTAKANQASISALQVQPLIIESSATNTSKLEEITFTFNVEGSYSNLIKILRAIQNQTRLISIDNLIINKVESNQNLLMSVSGKAYYLK